MHRVTLGSLLFVCLLGAARSQVNVNIPGIVDVAVGGSDVAVDVFGKRGERGRLETIAFPLEQGQYGVSFATDSPAHVHSVLQDGSA